LILKLGNYRRDTQTSTRPIIFVAHSLGGLVVANSLAAKYNTDAQGKEVVDCTYGTIFLGTPFKGSDKAPWAEVARRLLSMFGDSTDQTIKDLDKRSKKLQQISIDFHMVLQQRLSAKDLKPIQVACFFEEIKTSKTWWRIKKDLGHIVTADSATLVGYKQVGINADHVTMCRYPNAETSGYKLVTGKIKEMIANFKKSTDQLKREGGTVITFGDVNMGDNAVNIGGYISGIIMGTTENAVNMSLVNHFGSEVATALENRAKPVVTST